MKTKTETKEEKLNRYQMGWSQADNGWIVVYAHDLEEAEMLFEEGDYVIEEDNDAETGNEEKD